MRARDRGRAFGQIVALGAALAVICTAAPATASAEPAAQRQPQQGQPQQPAQQRVLKIYVVGDSYSSGEGIKGVARGGRTSEANSYFDSADPRHQSTLNAASQAAARLQEANPGVQVEIHIVASSGATTSDVFKAQRRDPLETIPGNTPQDPVDQGTWHESNDLAVNFPQLGQIPADADAVIMGFGGNDAFFGPLAESFVFEQWSRNTMLTREALELLENGNTDATYRAQARMNQPGYAPTLIARLLQVQEAIQKRAPNAKMIFQNYPLAVDPAHTSATDLLTENALRSMREFGVKVNEAIKRAAAICGCSVADVSDALKDRELNTSDPAINGVFTGYWGKKENWTMNEPLHPNRKGAGLMADRIAETWAKDFGLKAPPRQGDRLTDTGKVKITNNPAPDTDGDGVPDYKDKDWDGDGLLNTQDSTPNKPNLGPPPAPAQPAPAQPERPNTGRPGTTAPTVPQGPRVTNPTKAGPRGRGPGASNPGTNPTPAPPQQPSPPQQQPVPPQQPSPPQQQPAPPQQPSPPQQQPAPPQQPSPPQQQPVPPQQPRPPQQPAPPQQPSPPQQQPTPPQPAPPQPNPGSGTPKPAPVANPTIKRPTIQPPSTAVRYPSVPKTPSAPAFNPNFGPPGSPPRQVVKPLDPQIYKPPTLTGSNPNSPYPLGGSKPGPRPNGSSAPPPPPPPPSRPPSPPPSSVPSV